MWRKAKYNLVSFSISKEDVAYFLSTPVHPGVTSTSPNTCLNVYYNPWKAKTLSNCLLLWIFATNSMQYFIFSYISIKVNIYTGVFYYVLVFGRNMTTINIKNWWKPMKTKCYQIIYFYEYLLLIQCKISYFQSFQLKSLFTPGFSIMCCFLMKYNQSQY